MAAKTLLSLVGGVIKSDQRGRATWNGTDVLLNVTITAVVLNKTFITFFYRSSRSDRVTARLTTTTNLEISRTGATSAEFFFDWEVIEYE